MGRGNKIGANSGNANFRRVCWEYKREYTLAHRENKRRIAIKVLDRIASLNPSGRVLQKTHDEKGYVIVHPERAIEKTCQLLREKNNKNPDGMLTLPLITTSTKTSEHTHRSHSKSIEASCCKQEQEYGKHEKPKVAKAKKPVKHKRTASTKTKKKTVSKTKKTTNRKSMSKKYPDMTKSTVNKIGSSDTVKEKVVKGKKTSSKCKKVVAVSTLNKTTIRPQTTTARKAPRMGTRRSMRNIISKSIHEAYASTDDDDQSDSIKADSTTSMIPKVIQGAKTVANPTCITVKPSRDEIQAPWKPALAFQGEAACDNVDSKKDQKPASTVTAPEIPEKEFLRGFSGFSTDTGNSFDTGDDDFEKDLEGITEPPLTSLVARGVSLCSFGPGSSFEHKERGPSPHGVNEITANPTTLKPCNSLFVEGFEGSATHGSISPAIFDKYHGDDTRGEMWK